MIDIRYESDDVVVQIPKTLEHSGATAEELTALSEEIKADWWSENRERFLKGTAALA